MSFTITYREWISFFRSSLSFFSTTVWRQWWTLILSLSPFAASFPLFPPLPKAPFYWSYYVSVLSVPYPYSFLFHTKSYRSRPFVRKLQFPVFIGDLHLYTPFVLPVTTTPSKQFGRDTTCHLQGSVSATKVQVTPSVVLLHVITKRKTR